MGTQRGPHIALLLPESHNAEYNEAKVIEAKVIEHENKRIFLMSRIALRYRCTHAFLFI